MSLSAFTLQRSSYILVEGDSETDLDQPFRLTQPIETATATHYAQPILVSGQYRETRPIFVNRAVSGSTIQLVADRVAPFIGTQQFTHVILAIGTNEYTVTRAATQASLATLVGLFTTQQILVIGPYAYGEKWPSGQNTNDTRLDETDVDIADAFSDYANSIYVSPRSTVYTTVMPPLNLPAPGAAIGPFTIDSLHVTPRGRNQIFQTCIAPIFGFSDT